MGCGDNRTPSTGDHDTPGPQEGGPLLIDGGTVVVMDESGLILPGAALVVEGLQLVVGGAPEGGPCSALPSYGGGHLLVDLAHKAAVGGALDADGMR